MTDGEVGGDRIEPIVEGPSAAEAASAIRAAMARGRVASLVGECEVDVPGRDGPATGNRHVLLKPDGTVVVHGGDGAAPTVTLSGDSELAVNAVDDTLEFEVGTEGADGRLRVERVDVLAHAAIDLGHGTDVAEDRASAEDATHEKLRERLLSEPDRVEPGFRPLATERETSAGSVDLYGRDVEGRAVVVEIKGHRVGPAAVGQLDRYVAALRRDLHADAEVRGILVAPSATDRTRRLLDERGFAFRALVAA